MNPPTHTLAMALEASSGELQSISLSDVATQQNNRTVGYQSDKRRLACPSQNSFLFPCQVARDPVPHNVVFCVSQSLLQSSPKPSL
jgi:hypothetical protein